MSEPSAALTKPNRTLRTALITGGAAALLVIGGLGAGTIATAQPTGQARGISETNVYVELTPANQPVDAQESQTASNVQEAAIAQAAADAAAAQAAAEQAAQAAAQGGQQASGSTRCPNGTTANAVDAAGNESNCIANGPGNTQCVAFDENNNCTAYYKP